MTDPIGLELDPEQEYRSAMRGLIATRWVAVWEAVPVAVAGEDPEGVHRVRVASRRLRSAMDVSTECFAEPWFRPLHKTAKAITSALGDVRDRDVLIEVLQKQRRRASAGERIAIDHLTVKIERERDEARIAMTAFLTDLDSRGIRKETARRFPVPKPPKPPNEKNAKSGRKSGKQGSKR